MPRYFDTDLPIVLEFDVDPESNDERGELFATVQVRVDVDDALNQMDRFFEGWWLDRSPASPTVLVFDVEFAR